MNAAPPTARAALLKVHRRVLPQQFLRRLQQKHLVFDRQHHHHSG